MMQTRTRVATIFVAILGIAVVHAAIASTAQVDKIELQQTQQALSATYAKGKRIGLPRLIVMDGQGRPIYGGPGYRDDLPRLLREAYRKDKPLKTPITLAAILAETQKADGSRLSVADLPTADMYIADYWAQWCEPCKIMTSVLGSMLNRWDGVHSVWLKIESDPEKIDDKAKH